MPRFNPTGWQKVSKPCTECGVDVYYIKPIEGGKVDTKQFHARNCPTLPIMKEHYQERKFEKITDVEFKEVVEETKLLK